MGRKLKEDYRGILEKILHNLDLRSNINPVRCHEVAYLTNAGLKQKGYDSFVEDGKCESYAQHSWVVIPGPLGRINGAILNFNFIHLSQILPLPLITSKNAGEIITSWFRKRDFKRIEISYTLAGGIEELAKELFGPAARNN